MAESFEVANSVAETEMTVSELIELRARNEVVVNARKEARRIAEKAVRLDKEVVLLNVSLGAYAQQVVEAHGLDTKERWFLSEETGKITPDTRVAPLNEA